MTSVSGYNQGYDDGYKDGLLRALTLCSILGDTSIPEIMDHVKLELEGVSESSNT